MLKFFVLFLVMFANCPTPSEGNAFKNAVKGFWEIYYFLDYVFNPFYPPDPPINPDMIGKSDVHCVRDQFGLSARDYWNAGNRFFEQEQWPQAIEQFKACWSHYLEMIKVYGVEMCLDMQDPIDIVLQAHKAALNMEDYNQALQLCGIALGYPFLDDGWREYCNEINDSISRMKTKKEMQSILDELNTNDPVKKKAALQRVQKMDAYKECTDEITNDINRRLAAKPYAKCYVSNRNRHPLLILSPVKEEVMNIDPLVVVFHDIILKQEVERFKQISEGKLNASLVYGANQSIEFTRKSQIHWVLSDEFPHLTNRLEAILGLDLLEPHSEQYQVAFYKLGGHYLPHLDHWSNNSAEIDDYMGPEGNRLATLLMYLSDVEKGGRTIFKKLNISVTPQARTALFWFNLHPNGTGDDRTLHGACPVLEGTKWAINKWVREGNQLFTKQCHTDINGKWTLKDFSMDDWWIRAKIDETLNYRKLPKGPVPGLKYNLLENNDLMKEYLERQNQQEQQQPTQP